MLLQARQSHLGFRALAAPSSPIPPGIPGSGHPQLANPTWGSEKPPHFPGTASSCEQVSHTGPNHQRESLRQTKACLSFSRDPKSSLALTIPTGAAAATTVRQQEGYRGGRSGICTPDLHANAESRSAPRSGGRPWSGIANAHAASSGPCKRCKR